MYYRCKYIVYSLYMQAKCRKENQFLKKQNKELIEKIEKLSRELGDKERQLMELRKERAQYLIAAESSEADKYGLHKSKDISSKEE